MKVIYLLCSLVFTLSVQGASVVWDCFTQSKDFIEESDGTKIPFNSFMYKDLALPAYISPSVAMTTSKHGNNVTLYGDIGPCALAFEGLWIEKAVGDLIAHSTMTGQSEFFATTFTDENHQNISPIETTVGSTIYLAVMQGFDTDSPEYKYYGWLELYVEANGDITLTNSAMSIDGSPLFVGGGSAIPEPTSAMLICLGLMGLALKRRF